MNEFIKYLRDIINAIQYEESGIKAGKKLLSVETFKQKKGDTLFILGSGESINALDEANWKVIHRNTSFAFNYFLLHEFVPDYYFFETPRNVEFVNLLITKWGKKKEYKNIPLIIQGIHYRDNEFGLSQFEKVYFHYPYRLKTTNPKLISHILKCKFIAPGGGVKRLIHHAASVSYLVDLGVKLGFKKIVLLGIDLQGGYFYDNYKDEDSVWMQKNYTKRLSKKKHMTADMGQTLRYGELPIQQYLKIYKSTVLKREKVILMAGSSKSLLSKFLPVYRFDEYH